MLKYPAKFLSPILPSLALVTVLAAPTDVTAKEAGDLLIRARVIVVAPDESATTSIGGTATVGNETTIELDFTYFFTNNIAAELILATSKHSVAAPGTILGDVDLGSVWLLPPTLNIQYHFQPDAKLSPYVGAGVNLTLFHSINPGAVVDVDYDAAFGFGLQGGVDYRINDRTYINFDVKRLWLKTDVTIDAGPAGIATANVKLNPWIFGIGIGKTF